jgi:type VII secretion-associated serine protease mycosin
VAAATAVARARRSVVLPRSASTRLAPAVVAAGVLPGQAVRVSAVRLAGALAHVDVVRATGPQAAQRAVAAAQADPDVVAVQIDHRVQLQDVSPTASPTAAAASSASLPLSDDPYRSQQWALTALRAESAWAVSRGAGQVVGVVDSGVDATHPDLVGRILTGTDLVSPGGDGRTDPYGHGTHVAGIIAADAGNGIGVAGLAPLAQILPVRALDATGGGWDSDIATGIIWAADHGASIVSLSLGGPDASDAVRSAVTYAIGKGALVVAAVGNERASGDPVEYPAGFTMPGLLAVAATTSDGVSASYSNTGTYVTIAAPGSSVLSTYPGGSYALMSGTSMATPYVTAAAALIRSAVPTLTPAHLAAELVATADDLETAGRDDDTGAGLVDPLAALCALSLCSATASPSPSPTASPSGSPTSSTDSPSPSATPTSAAPLGVAVRIPASPIVSGARAVLTVTVSDADGPVAGAGVIVVSGDRSARGTTDATGVARVAVAPARTATWTVTATAVGHPQARAGAVVAVASKVTVRWRGSKAEVTVGPVDGQVVAVWLHGSRGWTRSSSRSAASGGVSLSVPASGGVKVIVSAVSGLRSVTVVRP